MTDYSNGQGVPQNYAEAMKWFRKAADQGNPRAQHNLGFMYANGEGVVNDLAEAVKWYRKAADQGYRDAQFNFASIYASGLGYQDYVQAHMWLNLAAMAGDQEAAKYKEGEMAFWVVRAGKHGENEAYAVEQQIGGEPFRDRRADALEAASQIATLPVNSLM
jgi:TPR repeat protein